MNSIIGRNSVGAVITKTPDIFKRLDPDVEIIDDVELEDEVEVDLETTGLDFLEERAFSLQVSSPRGPVIVDLNSIPIESFLPKLEGRKLLGHNIKFDLKFMMKHGFFPAARNVGDTQAYENCLVLGKESFINLASTAKRRIQVNIPKDRQATIMYGFRHKYDLDYAFADVTHLRRIRDAQFAESPDQYLDFQINSSFMVVLAYIEFCGIKVDRNEWMKKVAYDQKEMRIALQELNDYCYENVPMSRGNQIDMFSGTNEVNVNWGSPAQVIPILEDQGLDITVKGKKSSGKKAIQKYKRTNELVRRLLNYRERLKVCNAYGESFLEAVSADGRIHTDYKPLVSTGRMSCGRKVTNRERRKPNLQNIPKVADPPREVEARNCFVPEPGNVFIIADFASQESRILADLTKDKGLMDFYLTGGADLHSYVAQLLWPDTCGAVELKEVKKLFPAQRDKAKTANFAIAYGGNGFTIAENANVSDEEGEEVYEAYMRAFPGVAKFFDINLKKTLINGYITINEKTGTRTYPLWIPGSDDIYEGQDDEDDDNYRGKKELAIPYFKKLAAQVESEQFQKDFKRHRNLRTKVYYDELLPLNREYNRLKAALLRKSTNYLIQGTAALQTKLAGILFYEYLRKEDLLGTVKIVNVVHDEYDVECPIEIEPKTREVLVKCMEDGGNYFMEDIPMEADAHTDTKWSK